MLFTRPILDFLGYTDTPPFVRNLQENQATVFISLFLMSTVAQNFMSTGAFEISLNGKMLFSKLETGRMPTLNEIVSSLDQYGLHRASGSRPFADDSI